MSLVLISTGKVTREKQWPISNTERSLICRYSFHYFLAHDVGIASDKKWLIKDESGEREIGYEEARKVLPNPKPRLGPWEGYSLVVIFLCVLVGVLFTSSVTESISWLLNTIVGVLLIAVFYFLGNYFVGKFKK